MSFFNDEIIIQIHSIAYLTFCCLALYNKTIIENDNEHLAFKYVLYYVILFLIIYIMIFLVNAFSFR